VSKVFVTSGKRKSATARAVLNQEGKGVVTINGINLDVFSQKYLRMAVQVPIQLAGDSVKSVDIHVKVGGGGITTQADACALAIARALVKNDKKNEKVFLDYDRALLVADVRRKESAKPNRHGQARSKIQKSYR
jgi:small subunit ribosomal protein S9